AAKWIVDVLKVLRDQAAVKAGDGKSNDDLKKKWGDFLRGDVLPYIAKWKQDHDKDVHDAVDLPVPAGEGDAFSRGVAIVSTKSEGWESRAAADRPQVAPGGGGGGGGGGAGGPPSGGPPTDDHEASNTQAEIDHYRSALASARAEGDSAAGDKGEKALKK